MTKPVEETTLKLIADALKSYSQILETMAEIEETAKKTFDVLKEVFNPDRLAEMRNRLPPDLYAEFAASLFKLASVPPKLQNPLALTTEEKKKISDDMLKIAETIAKISKISI